jgi:hypothetical protein
MIDLNTLEDLFSDIPGKQRITFEGQCSDCGCDVVIKITPTSSGFGLQGGSLYEHTPSIYLTKCADCFQVNPTLSVTNKPEHKCTMVR